MIKSNELRVGNIVQRNGDWELAKEGFHTIIAINSSTLADGTFDSVRTDVTGQDFLFTTQLDAIPLTEEVLLYFGFEDSPPYGGDNGFFKRNGVVVHYEIDSEDPNYCYWLYKKSGQFTEIKIKYVHQIQNLYFALTGEELPIEQPTL